MKKIFTLIMALIGMGTAAHAQDFAYQLNGETLADGSTVTIEAVPDFFGDPECNTNPSENFLMLTFNKLSSSFASSGKATINIQSNTLGVSSVSWCMGGQCVNVSGTTYEKDFSFANGNTIVLQYDTAPQKYGEMLTKMVSTIGGQDYTLYIRFTYTDPASVENINDNQATIVGCYNMAGQKIGSQMSGLTIRQLSNGKVVKVLTK